MYSSAARLPVCASPYGVCILPTCGSEVRIEMVTSRCNYVCSTWMQILLSGETSIGDTLANSPYSASWNGPLWAVRFEFALYLITAVMFSLSRMLTSKLLVILSFSVSTGIAVLVGSELIVLPHMTDVMKTLVLITPFYFAGSLFYVFRAVVHLSRIFVGIASLALGLAISFHATLALAAIPLTYLVLVVGTRRATLVSRYFSKNDYSYGVYVLAFPIQQVASSYQLGELGLLVLSLISVLLASLAAVVSWHCVEKPAMQLRSRIV